MKKLCILGGGSLHTPLFLSAMSKRKDFDLKELCLFDINETALKTVAEYSRYLAARLNLNTHVTETTSIERAVAGATHILNMMRVGGAKAILEDRQRLALSGISGHAASFAEACRLLPVLMPYLSAIDKNAPRATLINFSNPVSVACNAIARYSSLNFIGLCYHSTKLRHDFAALLGMPPDDLEIFSFGLNHFSWITDAQVKGKSCFKKLVDAIARLKIKDYNYDCIQTLNAVPIGHAYSMYHHGSRYLAPEKGKRGNLEDIAYRFFVSKPVYTRHFMNRQNRLLKAYAKKDLAVIDGLRRKAPWYESCIVPFLADLMQTSKSIEYLLTIRGADNLGRVRAYEVPCTVRNSTVDRKKAAGAVPEFVINAVQNIAASEELMIEAIMKRSAALGMQAMVIHPHVYSHECARRFCDFYLGRA